MRRLASAHHAGLYRALNEEEQAANAALANLPLQPYKELRTPRADLAASAAGTGVSEGVAPDVTSVACECSDSEAHPASASAGRECGICLEDFENEQLLRVLPCGHYFHPICAVAPNA